MKPGMQLPVSAKDRSALEVLIKNRNIPQKTALRARIVLLSASGTPASAIMRQLSTTAPTITRWRARYTADGLPGLMKDRARPGRKRRINETQVRTVVDRTVQEKPAHATHWSTRTRAASMHLIPATIQRIGKAHGLKPHQVRSFKLNRVPQFVEKL